MSVTDDKLRPAVEAIIGADGLDALLAAGFSVHREDAYEAWAASVEASRDRLKVLATAAVKASGMRALLVELSFDDEGRVTIVVCDPTQDEEATCRRIVRALGVAIDSDSPGTMMVPGPAPRGAGAGA